MAIRRLDDQIAVPKRGVRKPVTEGIKRLGAIVLVTAVAYENAFFVDNTIGSRSRIVIIVNRIILPTALKRCRQAARRIHFAEQNFGRSFAAFLSWVPVLQYRRDAIDPFVHVDTAAGREEDDRVLVGGRHFTNQLMLSGWQTERAIAAFAFGRWIETRRDHNNVGAGRQLLRVGKDVGALGNDPHAEITAAPYRMAMPLENDLVGTRV